MYQNRQYCRSLWQPQALHTRDREHSHQQPGRQAGIFNLDIFGEIPLQVSPRFPIAKPAMKPTLNVLSSFGYIVFFPPPPHPPLLDRSHKHSLSFLINA